MNSERIVVISVVVICSLVIQAIMYGAVAFVIYDVDWWLLMSDLTPWGRFVVGLSWISISAILTSILTLVTAMFLDGTR
jgi:hypothetical protein